MRQFPVLHKVNDTIHHAPTHWQSLAPAVVFASQYPNVDDHVRKYGLACIARHILYGTNTLKKVPITCGTLNLNRLEVDM